MGICGDVRQNPRETGLFPAWAGSRHQPHAPV